MLCKYRNMFGEPGKGIHSLRLCNVAVVDVLATVLIAIVVHHFLPSYRFATILVVLFAIGIVAHRIFCVRTTVDRLLFGNKEN